MVSLPGFRFSRLIRVGPMEAQRRVPARSSGHRICTGLGMAGEDEMPEAVYDLK